MLSCNQIIVVAALLCVGLVAGDSVTLAVNESKELPFGVTMGIENIQDSRCPANADCIWAGEVYVRVRVAESRNSMSITLFLGPGQPSTTAQVALQEKIYRITLRSVLPYPGLGSTEAEKATLEVRRI